MPTVRLVSTLFLIAGITFALPLLAADPQVTSRTLFDGKQLGPWESIQYGGEGEVAVENGVIAMQHGVMLTGVRYTKDDLPKVNYELSWQGRRINGIDFFAAATFPVGDSFCSFIPGGWGGAVVGLSSIDKQDASDNETTDYLGFKDEQWYQFRVRVLKNRIQAWIDDKKMIDVDTTGKKISTRNDVDLSHPLAFFAWQSAAQLKNIQLKVLSAEEIKAAEKTPK